MAISSSLKRQRKQRAKFFSQLLSALHCDAGEFGFDNVLLSNKGAIVRPLTSQPSDPQFEIIEPSLGWTLSELPMRCFDGRQRFTAISTDLSVALMLRDLVQQQLVSFENAK